MHGGKAASEAEARWLHGTIHDRCGRWMEGKNVRVPGEAFAEMNGLKIVADIPRCQDINRFEDLGMTVFEGDKDLPISRKYMELAENLID